MNHGAISVRDLSRSNPDNIWSAQYGLFTKAVVDDAPLEKRLELFYRWLDRIGKKPEEVLSLHSRGQAIKALAKVSKVALTPEMTKSLNEILTAMVKWKTERAKREITRQQQSTDTLQHRLGEAVVTRLLESDDFDPAEYASQAADAISAQTEADLAAGNITANTIRRAGLRAGHYIYSRRKIGAQAKVTSVQLWPTRPNDFCVKWKYGLYEYGDITPQDADQFSLKPGPSPEEHAAQQAEKRNQKRQSVYNRDDPKLGESSLSFGR